MRKVVGEGITKRLSFCHAVVAGDFIYVSGTLGSKPNSLEWVEGGTGPLTAQTLRNMKKTLSACGASFQDVVKMNVFLTAIGRFE